MQLEKLKAFLNYLTFQDDAHPIVKSKIFLG